MAASLPTSGRANNIPRRTTPERTTHVHGENAARGRLRKSPESKDRKGRGIVMLV
jgi:hypothetical protein